MGAYLIDHPPAISQYGSRSRRPTGLTVLHTAESVMDTVGPDTGAEAVADFIRRRTTYGSYHSLVDSDSRIVLVPFHLSAWQDGTGSNPYALSISFACRTSDWRAMSAAKRAGFLRQGALAFAEQQAWLKANGYPTTPLRMVSKAESDAGAAGFIYHGHRDPGRRSDPGVAPPNLFPLAEFIEQCRAVMAGEPLEDDVLNTEDRDYIREEIGRNRNMLASFVKGHVGAVGTQVATLAGHVAALAEAVSQLASNGGGGLDSAAIAAAAERGAEKALSDLGDALKSADEA